MHSSYCDQNIKQAIPLLRTEWYTVNVGFERGRMHGQADIIYRHAVSSESSNRKLNVGSNRYCNQLQPQLPHFATASTARGHTSASSTHRALQRVLDVFWRRLSGFMALSYDRQFQKFIIIIFIYVNSSTSSSRGIWGSVRNRSLVEIQEPLLEESSTRCPCWAEC